MPGLDARRRDLIAAIGCTTVIGLAGCSGDGGSTPTGTATPTPAPATPNPEASEHYSSAVDTLTETKATLEEWAGSSFEADRVSALQDQVSQASEELSAAKGAADPAGPLSEQIEQAMLVADLQELSLAYYESVNVFFQVVEDASQFGENEQHQQAADTYADLRSLVEDMRQVIEEMGTVLDGMDDEVLAAEGLAYGGGPLDHIDLADRAALDAGESYAIANENTHLAFVHLNTGKDQYDNEAFTEAREAWETGRQRAKDAKAAFESTIDNQYTPENLRQDSSAKLDAIEGVIEAFDSFVAGAQAAEAGNLEEASSLVLEGFDLLEQAYS